MFERRAGSTSQKRASARDVDRAVFHRVKADSVCAAADDDSRKSGSGMVTFF